MANRKGLRTISTSDDVEGPLLRSVKKKPSAWLSRDGAGKSAALLVVGTVAGALLIGFTYHVGPFGSLGSMSRGTTVPITLASAAKASAGTAGGGDPAAKITSTTVMPGGPDVFYSNSSFPWDEELVEVETCDNSCNMARNGKCDDGRAGTGEQAFCDLGTDCKDCGPWTHKIPKSLAASGPIRPVAQLMARGLEVRTRKTRTVPSFLMPYTNWKHDVDVSEQMEHSSAVEQGLTQVWYMQLKDLCKGKGGKQGLVVDVGGNFGWYSLFSAAVGCRVVAWEPVPHFRLFFMYGLQLNQYGGLVQIRTNAVADKAGTTYELVVPQRGIWGTASINGANIDQGIDNEGEYEKIQVVGERVDAVVKEDVVLIKMDVEGFEPTAFASASGLFDNHKVENLCMEYSPGVYERSFRWTELTDWPNMLLTMLEKGMRIVHVRDEHVRRNMMPPDWSGPLNEAFEEVVAENVKWDLQDCMRLADRQLTCPMHPEVKAAFPTWGCNFIPEGLHPKSFRGIFGHNTNIFATIHPEKYNIEGPVGIFGLDEPINQWVAKKQGGQFGMGRRNCAHLKPEVHVMHRCKCGAPDICGKDDEIINRLAQEGKAFPGYLEAGGGATTDETLLGVPTVQQKHRHAKRNRSQAL